MAHGEAGDVPYGVPSRTKSADFGRRAAIIVAAMIKIKYFKYK